MKSQQANIVTSIIPTLSTYEKRELLVIATMMAVKFSHWHKAVCMMCVSENPAMIMVSSHYCS